MTPSPRHAWRASTHEHDPAVLRRLLDLRQLPLFAGVDLAELVVVAENIVESFFLPGEEVAPARTRLPCMHLVIEGRVELASDPSRAWTARQHLGLLEVLTGRHLPAPAIATAPTRTYELEGADLFEILEDNFGLLASLLALLATRVLSLGPPPHGRGGAVPAGPLGLVERMIVIREQVPFLSARVQPLSILAHACREVTWLPGATVAKAAEPARDIYMILEGALDATRGGGEIQRAGAGTSLGALEVLAGKLNDVTLTAATTTRALAIASTAIFDVLEDHPELALSTLTMLAAAILDAEDQSAATRGTTAESNSRPVPSIA